MHDGDDEDGFRALLIHHAIGKPGDPTTASAPRKGMPGLGISQDTGERLLDGRREREPQPRAFLVVIGDRFLELPSGRLQEQDAHADYPAILRNRSAASTVPSAPVS